jgi:tRNA(Ile)-lysidine synthase TilS/MesJ
MRPFLKVRKNLIQDYLKEVGEVYREDSTNSSERFMRARMRAHIMPELERLFPKAVDHLTALALDAQSQSSSLSLSGLEPYEFLLRASGIKARRPHLETILEKVVANRPWYGEIHLPGGWRLVREKKNVRCEKMDGARFQESDPPLERWVLERLVSSQNSLIPRSDAEKVGVG